MEAAEQREQESRHSGDVMQMQSGCGQLDLTPPCCIRLHSFTRQGKRLAWPEFCKRSKLMRLILLPTLRSGKWNDLHECSSLLLSLACFGDYKSSSLIGVLKLGITVSRSHAINLLFITLSNLILCGCRTTPRVKGNCTWTWSHVERLASGQLL